MLLTADKIFDGRKWLPAGTVIETDEAGTIIALHNDPELPARHYDGIITPGFVNCHCHLELSHMKGAIPEATGLVPFLQTVMQLRGNPVSNDSKIAARNEAFAAMYANGVVAVGDIANTNDCLDLRGYGRMHFHTFVEAIGFSETPHKQFERATEVYDTYKRQSSTTKHLSQSIVPHAPYTVSHAMFGMIDRHDESSLISIHNQESLAEDEYYLLKQGGMQSLLHGVGINDDFFMPSGKSSIETYLEWLSPSHRFLFVHNTYTKRNDIEVAKTLVKEPWWCLCPNANLYIESRLPDIDLFIQEDANICIGTDSLASNHQLSVLAELQAIKQHFPHIEWDTLLRWGTYNGAAALQMHDLIGSIEPGKQPGILHIKDLDSRMDAGIQRII